MSAPDTELKKQERRHWPSLIGMALGVLFALGLLAMLLVWLAAEGDTPGEDAQTPIDLPPGTTLEEDV
jgi:hypothetical protein